MEEVREHVYRIRVPLPRGPLKEVNCYLIEDTPPVLIDAGMNTEACYNVLRAAIEGFGKPIVIATHLHADHLGLAGRVADVVLMSREEIDVFEKFKSLDYWMKHIKSLVSHGFPKDLAARVLLVHPGILFTYIPREVKAFEGINVAGYEIEPFLTPGHTPGHLCLYERSEGLLFSGDHILSDITPNIGYWEGFNSLEAYLESLKATSKLGARIAYPGHRDFILDIPRRVGELLEHHRSRLREVLNAVVEGGRASAWQVAQRVSWDVKYRGWDEFPLVQKWFALHETIAHLEYLAAVGEVKKVELGGEVYYRC